MTLSVATKDGVTKEAYSDESPPEGGVNPRPVVDAAAGQPLIVQFMLTNVYPHGKIKNAGVRYYVIKEKEIGQKPVPDLKTGKVVVRGEYRITLKPKGRIGSRLRIQINEPGAYLLRVETLRTKSTHEHFSAIDLRIK